VIQGSNEGNFFFSLGLFVVVEIVFISSSRDTSSGSVV